MSEYIKREDVLKHARGDMVGEDEYQGWKEFVLIKDIKSIPAADVEPVREKGKWVKVYDSPALYKCSVCEEKELYCNLDYEYCPHCGAHMERSGTGE